MITSLPLKYRPKTYNDLVGQDTFVKYLKALSTQGMGRNIIFHGSFGTGKTSAARIYGKSLNCLNRTPSGDPCYTCEACKDPTGVIELDAASSSGKDDVKDLLEIARTPPMFGQYRVILADEAQQFSKAAWDALLKSIEEPKPFQVFLFSTTELNKVREAIRSRCQCLEVKLLSQADSKKHLEKICKLESIAYEPTALEIISFISRGHPRDLLKNLEQVSFLGDVSIENTKVIFNLGHLTYLLTLCKKLASPDTKSFRDVLSAFEESPKTIVEALRQFHLYLHYSFVAAVKTEINPLFRLIPEGDLCAFWETYAKVIPEPTEDFLQVISRISSLPEHSVTALEISLLSLHRFIHVMKCKEATVSAGRTIPSAPRIDSSVNNEVKQRKGRQFVNNNMEIEPLVPVETKPPVVPKVAEESDTVDAALLLQLGFTAIPIRNENDLIVFEEHKYD